MNHTSHTITPVLLLILCAGAAAGAEYQKAPNTDVEIVLPAGFAPVAHFNGFQNVEKKSSIMVEVLPNPYAAYRAGVTEAAVARQGGKLLSREELDLAGGKGLLALFEMSSRGEVFQKWALFFGDAKETVRVSGVYPASLKGEMSAAMKKAVLTARRSGEKATVRTEARPFTLEPVSPLKLAKEQGNLRIFSEGGQFPTTDPENMILVAGPSQSTVGVADREKYARERILKTATVKDIRIESVEPIEIDGLPGFEIVAKGRHEGTKTPLILCQVMLFEDVQYYLLIGMAGAARKKEALSVFAKTARTFDRRDED